MVTDKEKHEAFAAALLELYRVHPLPKYKYPKIAWRRQYDRDTALRNAHQMGDLFLVEMFASKVPVHEIRAVHSLIYG